MCNVKINIYTIPSYSSSEKKTSLQKGFRPTGTFPEHFKAHVIHVILYIGICLLLLSTNSTERVRRGMMAAAVFAVM